MGWEMISRVLIDSMERHVQEKLADLTERQKKILGRHKLTPHHLKTGFSLHTDRSLELALEATKEPEHVCRCVDCATLKRFVVTSLPSTKASSDSSTCSSLQASRKLSYLLSMEARDQEEDGEDGGSLPDIREVLEEESLPSLNPITGETESMRDAQRYLRQHQIFELFQFMVAHLLSACPFDPINFLVNLLDRCLFYRSGIGAAPLLYDKKHITCLFDLMDRMRTGFIEPAQYKTGMLTLGIKSYKPDPPLNFEGLVPKHFFVEEAYECLLDLMNDMLRIRPRIAKKTTKTPKAPPPSSECITVTENKKKRNFTKP